MIRKISFLFFFIIFITAKYASCEEIPITNFKFGLMQKNQEGEWYVYKEGAYFQITKNGKCTYNKKEEDCMWRGVEFDYKFPEENTILTCESFSSKASDYGNPREVKARNTRQNSFKINLPRKNGHKAVPGYTVYRFNYNTDTTDVKCYHNGQLVIEYKYTVAGFSLIKWIKDKLK
jgi:hypothetical protein